MNKMLLKLLPWILVLVMGLFLYLQYSFNKPEAVKDSTIVNHQVIVEKIVNMGKLELTKFYIKDVMEQTEVKDWWPDSKIILIIAGEVNACVDLSKVDSTDIKVVGNSIQLTLPKPEICYFKIDHSQSKVYSIENEYFEKSKLIDKAYAIAEKNIRQSALNMKILEHAQTQASVFLAPFLEQISGKKVQVLFEK
ncbi:MAG: DUF4230 domain-containing protein [Cytophagaceae bacterium]|jgi:hypothetical protein|nr:DUF4230 domain-containing protein [Cytophagaceae bacterium]